MGPSRSKVNPSDTAYIDLLQKLDDKECERMNYRVAVDTVDTRMPTTPCGSRHPISHKCLPFVILRHFHRRDGRAPVPSQEGIAHLAHRHP